ncbi:hypothetical protein F1C58_04325 [Glaciihabitans sp. INWT7]|uniref:hypothetical protein n=1 Tax=Glaciihabitans sp. INWT7 TaxID=2596912 RepID=UPI0016279877|nr:hypothetical protein [Glaciihabitans sp. INWT7]QNE46210.1 hypothetical protein F1C58_04325 [Glaciihabitans sp. INWT7]
MSFVARWVDVYTGGLPPEISAVRRDEIVSDLWEQSATMTADPGSEVEVARSIRSRAIRGAFQDLLWRDQEMRRFRAFRSTTMTPQERRSTHRLSWVLYAAATFVTTIGLVAAERAATNLSINAQPGASFPILASSVLAFVALGLLLRTATRAAGVGLLAISAWSLNWFLLAGSSSLSANFGTLLWKASVIISIPAVLIIGTVLLPLIFTALIAVVLRRLHRIEQPPSP